MPRGLLAALDSYEVVVVDRLSYRQDVPFNKLCGIAELESPEWRKALRDLDLDRENVPFHRKAWEFAHAVYGLRKLGRLPPDAVALGVGSGHEPILYFLANKIRKVIATDIYEGDFAAGHGSPYMLDYPEMFAPFHFRKDHLQVLVMDGRKLDFADNSFDFVFSFSSIEHFGGHKEATTAMCEMFRVLKPGGIAVITTELILNKLGRAWGFFRRKGIKLIFLGATGFDLVGGEVDYRIERRFLRSPMDFPYRATGEPCVVLKKNLTLFTSISLFLIKPPPDEGERKKAATGEERPHDIRRYIHKAEMASSVSRLLARAGEPIRIPLKVGNAGDVVWYNYPSETHTVRLGAHLLSANGDCLQWDFARQDLPFSVSPGEESRADLIATAPLRRGNFIIEIDLVKEGVLWFAEQSSPTLRIPLRVE